MTTFQFITYIGIESMQLRLFWISIYFCLLHIHRNEIKFQYDTRNCISDSVNSRHQEFYTHVYVYLVFWTLFCCKSSFWYVYYRNFIAFLLSRLLQSRPVLFSVPKYILFGLWCNHWHSILYLTTLDNLSLNQVHFVCHRETNCDDWFSTTYILSILKERSMNNTIIILGIMLFCQ